MTLELGLADQFQIAVGLLLGVPCSLIDTGRGELSHYLEYSDQTISLEKLSLDTMTYWYHYSKKRVECDPSTSKTQ